MAVDNITYVALKVLATHITTQIPALAGHVHVGAADPEDLQGKPCVVLTPQAMSFVPHLGVDEVSVQGSDTALLDVGEFEGTIEIQLTHKTQAQREELETRLLNLFLSKAHRGSLTLVTPNLNVGDIATLYQAPVSFDLLSSTWNDELVWEKKRMSFMVLTMHLPALIAESGVYTIEEYHTALTSDLVSVTPVVEDSIETDEDGNIGPSDPA